MADKIIDLSRFTSSQSEEIRQLDPRKELRSPAMRESAPDHFQKTQEREGRSEWSGGSMGGGTWGGRSR